MDLKKFLEGVGKRIESSRKNAKMTQKDLAKKAGYKSTSTIAKIESGTNDIPLSKLEDLAKILNVSPAYLMGWEDMDSAYDKISGGDQEKRDFEVATTLIEKMFNGEIEINALPEYLKEEGYSERDQKVLPEKIGAMSQLMLNGEDALLEYGNTRKQNVIDLLTDDEVDIITEYRALSNDGKNIVRTLLKREYEHIKQ